MLRMTRLASRGSIASVEGRGRHRLVLLTAAAAISTSLPSRVDAFVVRPPHDVSTSMISSRIDSHLTTNIPLRLTSTPTTTTTRLFSSGKNNNKEEGILKKVAKTFLPKSWFQTDQEKKAELARQQVKDNVKGGIQEMFKDAPLPVRIMGSMISPLLSRVASDLSESMAEQQRSVESVIDDARAFIIGDDVALQALGEPIQVGTPFSQSSSTTSINGQKTTNIAIAFPVQGSRSSGVAQAQANQNGIVQLVLQVDGRQVHVSLNKRGSHVGKNHILRKSYEGDDDNIIEAEIIEKDTKR
jgi:hypothetical protein